MVNYLISSSNVYCNYTRALGLGLFAGRDLKLIKCTQKAVLDAHLATLDGPGLVFVFTLENFLVTACSGVTDEEVQLFARQQVSALVDSLHLVVQCIPGVNVLIMPPIYRSDPTWYGRYLPDLHNFLGTEVAKTSSSSLAICLPFTVVPSMLEADRVHLNASAGNRFLIHLDAQLANLLVEVDAESTLLQSNRMTILIRYLLSLAGILHRSTPSLPSLRLSPI